MLDCYTLSLLSLSITLSIIIMIISTINAILEEKEKATRWEGGFTNKTVWTCYMHVIFIITFCLFVCLFVFWSFSRKKLFSFRIYNCVCKFSENKNKNLLKKKEIVKKQTTWKYGYDPVRIWENTVQRKPVFQHISRSVLLHIFSHNLDLCENISFISAQMYNSFNSAKIKGVKRNRREKDVREIWWQLIFDLVMDISKNEILSLDSSSEINWILRWREFIYLRNFFTWSLS